MSWNSIIDLETELKERRQMREGNGVGQPLSTEERLLLSALAPQLSAKILEASALFAAALQEAEFDRPPTGPTLAAMKAFKDGFKLVREIP